MQNLVINLIQTLSRNLFIVFSNHLGSHHIHKEIKLQKCVLGINKILC